MAMDIFGKKATDLLNQAQGLLSEAQSAMLTDIEEMKHRQEAADARLNRLEVQTDQSLLMIGALTKAVDDLRNSAIKGEIASGVPTKDVAQKFKITPSRVSQIAPRRRYNNG